MNIALLGYGTVGKRFAEFMTTQQDFLQKRTVLSITLKYIYTRSIQKPIKDGLKDLVVDSIDSILEDKDIDCVVELMGGLDYPNEVITRCILAKKHIVSANKALLARHGKELFRLAREHSVTIAFEASCGGGIPIIRTLSEGLVANSHSALYGVLNGTCNFIITEMERKNISFQEALDEAKAMGFAEADPTLDIEGFDSGHKIALLSSIAFQIAIDIDQVTIKGISEVTNEDIHFGNKLSYTLKLIAAGIKNDDSLSVWVHPAFIPSHHMMTHVESSFNAISSVCDEVGHTFYYGRGAGGKPTNSSIVSDIVSIANNSYPPIFDSIYTAFHTESTLRQTGIESLEAPVYIRSLVQDKPGTLAKISKIFASQGISIARVLQEDPQHSPKFSKNMSTQHKLVELIIITHVTIFSAILKASLDIEGLEEIVGSISILPIIENPEDCL